MSRENHQLREQAWSSALSVWAKGQADLSALVQVGSRVQPDGEADAFSDFDYYLISSRPERYRDGRFAEAIAPCWVVSSQIAFGGVTKVTAVYEHALDVDFVILAAWELRVAFLALRFPRLKAWWPGPLAKGIADLRCVAGRGSRVVHGGAGWSRRFERLAPLPLTPTEAAFSHACDIFWTQFVWVVKKVERGELLAAQRGFHLHLVESTLTILAMEADEAGRPRPEGRKAEQWLSSDRLRSMAITSAPSTEVLEHALADLAFLFHDASQAVAKQRGWAFNQREGLRMWTARRGYWET